MNSTGKWIGLVAGMSVLALFSGCLDIVTTNRVNRDGSIQRTVAVKGDSTELTHASLPVPIDSTWIRVMSPKDGGNQSTLTYSRTFHNVKEMNDNLRGSFGSTLQSRVDLVSSFQWFFTSYAYRESILKFNQFDTIPISDFLSTAEIDAWHNWDIQKKSFETKGDSVALMSSVSRVEEWERRNVFEFVLRAFLEGVRASGNPRLTEAAILKMKDSLYDASAGSTKDLDSIKTVFSRMFGKPRGTDLGPIWNSTLPQFRAIREKMEFMRRMSENSYTTIVEMPGVITGTNAPDLQGNRVTWKDYKDEARIFGYTMWVESREVNWWAVVSTGMVVVVLVAGLVVSNFRRRAWA